MPLFEAAEFPPQAASATANTKVKKTSVRVRLNIFSPDEWGFIQPMMLEDGKGADEVHVKSV